MAAPYPQAFLIGQGCQTAENLPSAGLWPSATEPRSSGHILANSFFFFIAKFKFTRKFQFSISTLVFRHPRKA